MSVTLGEAVRKIVKESSQPVSPAQIRDAIKAAYPHLYATDAHRIGIEKGNLQSFDHALLNPIYALVTRSPDFILDRSKKPMLVTLASDDVTDEAPEENYEADQGLVYVLGTGLYTATGKKIIKIGHTTQSLATRVAQLYTTGTPFQFEQLHAWRTRNYTELEQAMHRLFAPFRINRAREFFTHEVLEHIEAVAQIHLAIQELAHPLT